eukprot:1779098-Pleurochrysis_carterae.AAC.2
MRRADRTAPDACADVLAVSAQPLRLRGRLPEQPLAVRRLQSGQGDWRAALAAAAAGGLGALPPLGAAARVEDPAAELRRCHPPLRVADL